MGNPPGAPLMSPNPPKPNPAMTAAFRGCSTKRLFATSSRCRDTCPAPLWTADCCATDTCRVLQSLYFFILFFSNFPKSLLVWRTRFCFYQRRFFPGGFVRTLQSGDVKETRRIFRLGRRISFGIQRDCLWQDECFWTLAAESKLVRTLSRGRNQRVCTWQRAVPVRAINLNWWARTQRDNI